MRFASTGSPAASSSSRRRLAQNNDRRTGANGNVEPAGVRVCERGFTLLETMIALLILSFALTALYEASSTSIRAISASWQHMKARVLAETMLAEQTSLPVSKPQVTRGTYEQLEWEVEVAPGAGPWAELTTENNWSLYLIRVTVRWPIGRSLVLETARLGPRAGQ